MSAPNHQLLSHASILHLYRHIMRLVKRYPSIRRNEIAAGIRADFRDHQHLTDEGRLRIELARALDGLNHLKAYTGHAMNPHSRDWSLNLAATQPIGPGTQRLSPAQRRLRADPAESSSGSSTEETRSIRFERPDAGIDQNQQQQQQQTATLESQHETPNVMEDSNSAGSSQWRAPSWLDQRKELSAKTARDKAEVRIAALRQDKQSQR